MSKYIFYIGVFLVSHYSLLLKDTSNPSPGRRSHVTPFLQMYKDLEDGLAGLLSYAMGSDAVRAEAEAEAAAENEGKKAANSSKPSAQ